MVQEQWGRVIAVGKPVHVDLIGEAIREARQGIALPAPLEDLLPRDYRIEAKPKRDMIAAGAIIPGSISPARPRGVAAHGFVRARDLLWVQEEYLDGRPAKARHTVRHEICHPIVSSRVSKTKQRELLALMKKADGTAPTSWNTADYELSRWEIVTDKLAEACSNKDSQYDEFMFFDLDIPPENYLRMVEIIFRPSAAQPVPEPTPQPQPLPDPRIAQLEAAVLAYQERETAIRLILDPPPEE